ncbi:unnamed protein product [Moneuplotes crassus]|uniref:Uncharacterized protein n=1 Tax=Euplotes crassus TaxID=5936 RepID=A0AAD1UT04_EUPCR|nr:unnamed protein product [Moneuplotes crassus]
MKIYSHCSKQPGCFHLSKRYFSRIKPIKDLEENILNMSQYQKATEFFENKDYKKASLYYRAVLHKKNLPYKEYHWKGIEHDWTESYKSNIFLCKLYDKTAYSYLYSDRRDANDLFRFCLNLFNKDISFPLIVKYNLAQMILKDTVQPEKNFTALKNDEDLTKEQRAIAKNNLAIILLRKYNEFLVKVKGDRSIIPEKYVHEYDQVLPFFKEAIKGFETSQERTEEETEILNTLLNVTSIGPEDFYDHPDKAKFYDILNHPLSGISLTNICEQIMIDKLWMEKKHTTFWFMVGLKYHEKHETFLLAKHLSLLALYYNSQQNPTVSEKLLLRALQIVEGRKDIHESFTKKILGTVLMGDPERKSEADKYISEALQIENQIVPWAGLLSRMNIPFV